MFRAKILFILLVFGIICLKTTQTEALTKSEMAMVLLLTYKSITKIICTNIYEDDFSGIQSCTWLAQGPLSVPFIFGLYWYNGWLSN